MKIVQKFAHLPANELDFAPRHHSAFDTHSLEQLNIFSELLSRVQESNSESLSDLVMDVQSKNNMWDSTGWMSYIKYGLLGVDMPYCLNYHPHSNNKIPRNLVFQT